MILLTGYCRITVTNPLCVLKAKLLILILLTRGETGATKTKINNDKN